MRLSCKLEIIMYNTEPRKEILERIKEEGTISSINLVESLKDSVNKSTIYRNLKSLEEEKKIHKIYDEKKKIYEYQIDDDCENHFHLKCMKCGKIIHLHCDEANLFASHIYKSHGFMVSEEMTTIYGICGDCVC